MKQYLIPLLLLFLIPFSFAYAEKYYDESFGYSVYVPDKYSIATPFNDVVIFSSEKPNRANGADSINILVTRHDGKPLSEMMELVRNDLVKFGNTITDETEIKFGSDDDGKKGVLIKSHKDIGTPVFYENSIAYHENLAYFLTVTYTDSETQKTFHDMLESLEFAEEHYIPQWIMHVSAEWSEEGGGVGDDDLANAMRYMLIMFPVSEATTDYVDNDPNRADDDYDDRTILFPEWVRGIASSWTNGEIDNDTWKNLIAYLYENEIILL